jgi:hypothetical protein
LEEARARLVERLVTAGSAVALGRLESFDELRLLASFLWLPRDSAPLRRLGLRIQPPGAGMSRRATLSGPDFSVELDNYRFTATTVSRQREADSAREARRAVERLSAIADGVFEEPKRRPLVAAASSAPATPGAHITPRTLEAEEQHRTHPLSDLDSPQATRPLPAIGPLPHPTRPLEGPAHPLGPAAYVAPTPSKPEPASVTGRKLWPFGFNRKGSTGAEPGRE